MYRIIISIAILVSTSIVGMAQEQSNLQSFTPSVLFKKGEYEVMGFFNLYSQNSVRDREGNVQLLGDRQSFLNGMYQFTYGISPNARINVGLDVNTSAAFYTGYQRAVVSAVGPRIKINPISALPKFSIQSTFLFPVASNLESPRFVAHDRYTWNTQLFFDKQYGSKFQLFLEADFLYRIARDKSTQTIFFRTPVSVFVNYFPSSKFTGYTFFQYSPRFQKVSNEFETAFGLTNRFTQVGVGMKYQATPKLGLELSYSKFIDARVDGNGYTVNFGIRYIKRN